MFVERGINLNDLEKRSFYSFLALYLASSLLFVLLSGYWYYSAQKNSIESETYYKLEHFADTLSGLIINAHMMGSTLQLPDDAEFEYKLVTTDDAGEYKEGYFEESGYKVLISSSPREHLNIKYVVVKTDSYFNRVRALREYVLSFMGISFLAIAIISLFLARLFMKPVHKRIEQIEGFIQDVSHELNTPITALGMSASRAIKKGVYDKKILTNISISTKQLESIYKSLTYLNFSDTQEEKEELALRPLVESVVKYYSELSDAKGIVVETKLDDVAFEAIGSRIELLFSNLLSNAIKYSMPESKISITLEKECFCIKDEGVGIAKDKLDEVFKLYARETNIAGGFGVGLHIVKQICDAYNIRVEVSSVLGEGSEFRLYFT